MAVDRRRTWCGFISTSLNSRWSASSRVSANVLWFCGRHPCLIVFWSVFSSMAFPFASSMPYHAWEAYVSRLRNVDCVTGTGQDILQMGPSWRGYIYAELSWLCGEKTIWQRAQYNYYTTHVYVEKQRLIHLQWQEWTCPAGRKFILSGCAVWKQRDHKICRTVVCLCRAAAGSSIDSNVINMIVYCRNYSNI